MTFLNDNFKTIINTSEQSKARVVLCPRTDIKTSLHNILPRQLQNNSRIYQPLASLLFRKSPHGLRATEGISLLFLTMHLKATLPTEQSTPFLIRYMKYQKHGNNFQ